MKLFYKKFLLHNFFIKIHYIKNLLKEFQKIKSMRFIYFDAGLIYKQYKQLFYPKCCITLIKVKLKSVTRRLSYLKKYSF